MSNFFKKIHRSTKKYLLISAIVGVIIVSGVIVSGTAFSGHEKVPPSTTSPTEQVGAAQGLAACFGATNNTYCDAYNIGGTRHDFDWGASDCGAHGDTALGVRLYNISTDNRVYPVGVFANSTWYNPGDNDFFQYSCSGGWGTILWADVPGNTYHLQLVGNVSGYIYDGQAFTGVSCVPSEPNTSASCSADGRQVTINYDYNDYTTGYAALRYDDWSTPWNPGCDWTYGGDACGNVGRGPWYGGATPGHTYGYWVHQCNPSGCSSATGKAVTCPDVPPVVTGMNASCDAAGTMTLTFNPAAGATNYRAQVWTPTGNCPGWSTTGDGHTCYADIGNATLAYLGGGVPGNYAFYVFPSNNVGYNWTWGGQANFSCPALAQVPSVSASCNAAGLLSFSYGAVAGATSYQPTVYTPTGACTPGWTVVGDGHQCTLPGFGGTSGAFAAATPGNYSFYVYPANSLGTNWSNPTQVAVVCPEVPKATNPAGSCNAAGTVGSSSWTNASGYNTVYYRAYDNTTGAYVLADTFVGANRTFSTTPGHSYSWWVHTLDTATGRYSDTTGGSFSCISSSLTPPTGMNASCDAAGKITYSFNSVAGATGYYPRISTPAGVCPTGWTLYTDNVTCYKDNVPATGGATQTGTFTQVNVGASQYAGDYSFWVYPGDASGANYTWPGSKAFTCSALPKPTALSATCTPDRATCTTTWVPPAGYTTSYWRLYDTTTATYLSSLWNENVVGGTLSFPGTPGHLYSWWVHTKDTATGNWSDPVLAIADDQVPPPPTGPVGSCSAAGTLGTTSWTPPAGYNTFYWRLYDNTIGADLPGDNNLVGNTKTFVATPGHTYSWWVHTKDPDTLAWSSLIGGSISCVPACTVGGVCTSAANSCGVTSTGTYDSSCTCSAVTPGNSSCVTPGPPTLLGDTCSAGTINLTWKLPSGATYTRLRVDDQTANTWNGLCGGSENPGDTCLDNIIGTTWTGVGTPGHSYDWWIQACNVGGGCNPTPVHKNFSCPGLISNLSLTASPAKVRYGGTTNLIWSATNITSCTLSGPGVNISVNTPTVAITTTPTPPIYNTTTYTMSCTTPSGPRSTSIQVSTFGKTIEI